MMADLSKKIKDSMSKNCWDFGNEVLYQLCKSHFEHIEDDKIIAKVWLIGRAYAASVERQRSVSGDKFKNISNDEYYKNFIPSTFKNSIIDKKLLALKNVVKIRPDNLLDILSLHSYLIKILNDDSKEDEKKKSRRSFSSKYLHFHLPQLFFIYDSRACTSLKNYKELIDMNSLKELKKQILNKNKYENLDKEYSNFFLNCYLLNEYINEKYDKGFTCRNLDNMLINDFENTSK